MSKCRVWRGGIIVGMAVKFDTFQYAQILREAGVPESQLEGHIKAQAFALQDSLPDVLATREDLLQLDKRLSLDFEGLKNKLDRVLWLNGLVLALVAAMAAKLFLH